MRASDPPGLGASLGGARSIGGRSTGAVVNPVRWALGTAVAEGLLRHNPAARLRLPHRERIEEEDAEQVRALSRALVERLRAHLSDLPNVDEVSVFATRSGSSIDADNLRRRRLKPLMQEAGAPWAAFHTFRTLSPRCS